MSWTARPCPSFTLSGNEPILSRDCIGCGDMYALSSPGAVSGNVDGKKKNRGKSLLGVTLGSGH